MKTKQRRLFESMLYLMLTGIIAFVFQFNIAIFMLYAGFNITVYAIVAYVVYLYSNFSFKESFKVPLYSLIGYIKTYNYYSLSDEEKKFCNKYTSDSALVVAIQILLNLVFLIVQLLINLE